MTGKRYYMTTLGDWQRHAARFANSHFIVLDSPAAHDPVGAQHAAPGTIPWLDAAHSETVSAEDAFPVGARHAVPGAASPERTNEQGATGDGIGVQTRIHQQSSPETSAELSQHCQASAPGAACCAPTTETFSPGGDATRILVLIEADEGVHLSLEDEPAFDALPHPLAQKPISDAAQSALAPHGVAPGATMFDAAEALARIHPLLRHRVF